MFPTFERIKELSKKQVISLNTLEEKLGYSRNTIYALKRNQPGSEKLQQIADYFNVSTDYLLGRTDNPKIAKDGNTNSHVDLKSIALLKEELVYWDDLEDFNYLSFMEKYNLKTIADEVMVKDEFYRLIAE